MRKIIFINLLVVSFIFIVLEFSLRFIFDLKPLGIEDGIINDNNQEIRFNYSNIEGKKIFGTKVFTDLNGFRVSKNQTVKNENINKIFFIGGSVTFGSGVKQESTFSGILNSSLSNYNIINASVMGSDLKNNYLILKKNIKKNNVKKIFINFSYDDIEEVKIQNINFGSKKDNNKFLLFERLKELKLLKEINNLLRSRSVIYVFIKGYIFDTREYYYQNALLSYQNKDNLINMDKSLNNIKQLQNKNTEIIFIKIPYFSQVTNENCNSKDEGELKIINNLNKYDFSLIDFKPIFCSIENREKLFLRLDTSHLSEYGHEIVAVNLKSYFNK